MTAARPEASVVVEWETALEGKATRGAACLGSLRAQLAELGLCETVVCFDPHEADEASVRAAIGPDWPGELTVAAVPAGLDYYGKKNHGFTLTSGEVVVFLDSDLVPEPGWLRALAGSLADFRVSCVLGRTHLETSTAYERAVALFWIFDERDESAELRRTRRFVSNNFAVRRALFAHLRFPERPTFRGQCSEFGAMLEARRVPMHEQPAARAAHPPPEGARRFVARAVHAGSDQAYYDALRGTANLGQCVRNWQTDMRSVRSRVAHRAPRIGARRGDVIAAHVLGLAYYATKAARYAAAVAPAAAADGAPRTRTWNRRFWRPVP